MLRSLPPEASQCPSRLKARAVTARLWPDSRRTSLPSRRFLSSMVSSGLGEAIQRSSTLTATSFASLVWPGRVRILTPETSSHRSVVSSSCAAVSHRPSSLKETVRMGSVCSLRIVISGPAAAAGDIVRRMARRRQRLATLLHLILRTITARGAEAPTSGVLHAAESDDLASSRGGCKVTYRRSDRAGQTVPGPAAQDPSLSALGARPLHGLVERVRIPPVPALAPPPNIAVHVTKSPRVRLLLAGGMALSIGVGRIPGELVEAGRVILAGAPDVIMAGKAESPFPAASGRVLPLRLRRQPEAASLHKAVQLPEEFLRVIPGHLLDRTARAAFRLAGIGRHHCLPLVLGQLRLLHPETFGERGVPAALVLLAAWLARRAPQHGIARGNPAESEIDLFHFPDLPFARG